ncbi:MAG: HD domain-containing protein [Candidatus Diapherotrites archaeon]
MFGSGMKGRRMGRWNPEPEPPEGGFKPVDPVLLKKLRRFAEESMRQGKLPYHNRAHIRQFMRDADFLARGEGLGPEARENIMIAAMFHDIGNIVEREGHEQTGKRLLHKLLSGTELEPRREEIERLIIATDFTREPKTTAEKIMRDSDIASKGRRLLGGFFYQGRKLCREMKETGAFPKTESEWFKTCEQILSIPFYTRTAQARWEKGRLANLASIKRQKQYHELRRTGIKPVKAFVKSRKTERPRAK